MRFSTGQRPADRLVPTMNGEPEPATPVEPSPPAEVAGGLFTRVREHLSLSRVQAIFGILAALLSIGGALYGYLRPARTQVPHSGEIVATVRDAKSGKPIPDAALELLTQKDVLVTMLSAPAGEARRQTKEGTYRLRATHPRYSSEVRQIQVQPGQTAEVLFRLTPKATATAPTNPAERVVNEGVDSLKKIFR
jgi:carboxypeptidase family protein